MKLNNIKIFAVSIMVSALAFNCSSDDDMSGDDGVVVIEPDFSGTYAQEDQMGRPGINTVLSGSAQVKNDFNVTIPSNMIAEFQDDFLNQAVALHDAFGVSYEENILGLDAVTLTTILAADVLQVAPDGPTTYFNPNGSTVPTEWSVLTGRNLNDDVIDVSLILLFGGMTGDKYNGQDLDSDGTPDLPILVTDNVSGSGETPMSTFPYLEAPHTN